jgi:hypothetical protein
MPLCWHKQSKAQVIHKLREALAGPKEADVSVERVRKNSDWLVQDELVATRLLPPMGRLIRYGKA